jgi:16S rRNA processing protein RimM
MAGRPDRAPASPGPAADFPPEPTAVSRLPARPTDLVELGALRGPFGVHGWAHVQPHSPEAEVLRAARHWWLERESAMPHCVQVTGVRRHGAGLVAKWEGCDDPEAVDALRGSRILVSRADFPAPAPGEHYWVDLVGMRVVNRAGACLGIVTGLRNNGVHDILEIRAQDGADRLIPVAGPHIDAIDGAAREVRVDWEADW